MLKIVTLMKRRAGLSVEDFQNHLRNTYGPLAAKGPGLRRYVQSCALPQGYGKGELLFDAIGEMWFDTAQTYEKYLGSAELIAARADEATFLDATRTVVMPVDVHVIKDGRIPNNAVKNIEFVNKRPGMPLEPFRAYWRNVHGPLASTIPVMHRYEQNHLALSQYERNAAPPLRRTRDHLVRLNCRYEARHRHAGICGNARRRAEFPAGRPSADHRRPRARRSMSCALKPALRA